MTNPPPEAAIFTPMNLHRLPLALLAAASLTTPLRAQDPDLRELLRDALYTEEVTRDPEAAAKQYEALLARHDAQRAFVAAALFRFAEIRRKQDRKDEATALYQRLLREFPDSATEGKLARENLAALGAKELTPAKIVPPDPQSEEIRNLQKVAETMPDIIKRPEHLERAINNDNAKIAEFLIDRGADLNSHGYLLVAVQRGNLEIARLLLDRGADPNAAANSDSLSDACRAGFEEVARLLLSRGADPNLNIKGIPDPPLREAIMGDHPAIVRLLLEKGANPNHPFTTPENLSPGNPNFPPGAQGTQLSNFGGPIHLATTRTDLGILKLLLEKKADPGIADTRTGLTALHLATNPAWKGNREAIPLLLKAGAKPDAETKEFKNKSNNPAGNTLEAGVTPLHLALQNQLLPEARLLIEAGADPKRPGLLYATVAGGHLEAIQLLLEKGGDPNETRRGWPALHHAIGSEKLEVARALLEAGADPNSSSPGSTALHYVAKNESGGPMIDLLLEKGAKPDEGWKKSFFNEANAQIRNQLIRHFLFPEVAARKSITAFKKIQQSASNPVVFHEMATADKAEKPPLLHELVLAGARDSHGQIGFDLGGDSLALLPTEVLLSRRQADGSFKDQMIDLIHGGEFPELQWGDILEFNTVARDAGRTPPESPMWPLRKRVSFPVTVEIDGKSRTLQLRGDRLMFDPTKDEVPWVGAGTLVAYLWQPETPRGDFEGMEIVIARKGWQDIRLPYGDAASFRFPLERDDVVRLVIPPQSDADLAEWRRSHATLTVPGFPFTRRFQATHSNGEPPPGLPTLLQAIADAMISPHPADGRPADPADIAPWLLERTRDTPIQLLPHPDFSMIRHRRLGADGSEQVREIDLAATIAASSDATTPVEARKADFELMPGDIVELPLLTERLAEPWKGLTAKEAAFFAKALNCRVQYTDGEGKISLKQVLYQPQSYVGTEFGWYPVRRDTADPAGTPTMTASAALQIQGNIGEVTRDGVKFSELNLDPATLFVRDGDVLRLDFRGPQPPQPQRVPRPRVTLPPSR